MTSSSAWRACAGRRSRPASSFSRQRGPLSQLLTPLVTRLDLGEPIDTIGDAFIRAWSHVFAHDLAADARLVMPVEAALGLLAPKRAALAERIVELRVEAALQQFREHGLSGEIDVLHRAPRKELSYIQEM